MTSSEIALQYVIPEQRMKVSRFADLNDPFELASNDIGDKAIRLKTQAYITEAQKRLGLLCFSDNWESPVMWAHYANKHTGVCLGFDISDAYLTPVRYLEARILHQFSSEFVADNIQFIDRMLYQKAKEWSYEREIRAIVLLDEPGRAIHHIPFGHDLQLREVIVGCRNPLSPSDIEPFICAQETPVEIIKARPAFKKFEMVPNRHYKFVNVPAAKDCSLLHEIPLTGTRFLQGPESL